MLQGGRTAIAVSLTEETTGAVVARMSALSTQADLFEIRADFVRDLDLPALRAAATKPILFTCRPESEGGRWPDADSAGRRALLRRAVELGFDLVDVEARAGFDDVVAVKAGRGLVLSWHDFEGTPDDLDGIYETIAAARPRRRQDRRDRALGGRPRPALSPSPRRRAGGPGPAAGRARHGSARRRLAHPRRPLRRAVHVRLARERPRGRARASCPAPGAGRRLPRPRRSAPRPASTVSWARDVLRSLSPAIHNRAFAARGTDAVYVPLQAESMAAFPQALPVPRAVRLQRHAAVQGRVLPYLDSVDAARGRGRHR